MNGADILEGGSLESNGIEEDDALEMRMAVSAGMRKKWRKKRMRRLRRSKCSFLNNCWGVVLVVYSDAVFDLTYIFDTLSLFPNQQQSAERCVNVPDKQIRLVWWNGGRFAQ
jgi:hypothetical protein